jgi:Cd2+/Zn2+-exporting ATPase
MLALAAAVEAHSEHPIARAVVARARHEQVAIPAATDFQALPGRGARALVDGTEVTVGSPRLGAELGLLDPGSPSTADGRGSWGVRAAIARLAEAGRTPLLVAVADEPGAEPRLVGLIGVADAPRPDAAAAVSRLRAAGVPLVAVLTGDTTETGAAIAAAVGADEARAELLPADKAAAVRELRDRYGPVVMVGDGVNDAPALAAADVGVAMGGRGTDVALETADIALMRDDLAGVATAVTLSRRTTRVIRQNITLSLALKGLALALGALGFVDLWLAVAADMGTSLLVTANGMRLGIDGRAVSSVQPEAAPSVEPAPAVGS